MGRQIGLVHLSGKYGDVQLSITADGKAIAKLSRGVNGKRVKTAPNFARTRDNNAEFTCCSYAGSGLRKCLGSQVHAYADRKLHARLVKVMYEMLVNGPGQLGQRSLEVVAQGAYLSGVSAAKDRRLGSQVTFPMASVLSVNVDRNTATLNVPALRPGSDVRSPDGATHYRLMLVAGVLSDYEYVGEPAVYAPVNPELAGLCTTVEGPLTALTLSGMGAVQLVAGLPGLPVLPATAGLVVSVGITYYKVLNGGEWVLASGNALEVMGAF